MQGFCHANLPHLSLISDYCLSTTPGASCGSPKQAQTKQNSHPKQQHFPLSKLKEWSRGPPIVKSCMEGLYHTNLSRLSNCRLLLIFNPESTPWGPKTRTDSLKTTTIPFLGSSPDRGQSPVEWGDFLSVHPSIRPSNHPSVRSSVHSPHRGPKSQPGRP